MHINIYMCVGLQLLRTLCNSCIKIKAKIKTKSKETSSSLSSPKYKAHINLLPIRDYLQLIYIYLYLIKKKNGKNVRVLKQIQTKNNMGMLVNYEIKEEAKNLHTGT